MDLILVLSIDLEAATAEDTMPFGRLRSGELRLRGRLMPIKLDLSKWPDGDARKDNLVQYWAGSTSTLPASRLFLVPVVFTRWNARLPASTVNSLLVEATEAKGVYRCIGAARLSSLCPLNFVIEDLYVARSAYYEDQDDDANSDGEAAVEHSTSLPMMDASHSVACNPQQELIDAAFDRLRAGNKRLDASRKPSNPRLANPAVQNLLKRANRVGTLIPGKPTQGLEGLPQAMNELNGSILPGTNVTVKYETRNNMWVRRKVKKLEPRDAVDSDFYTEYLDDQKSSRFGHFVFSMV